jgi:hypothetical protein
MYGLLIMQSLKGIKLANLAAVVLACIVMQSPAQATSVSFVFQTGQAEGETLVYKDVTNTYTSELSAWATTGPDLGFGATIETATAHEMTNGLGVCNQSEGTFATCLTKNNRPAIGNGGIYEWILVYLPSEMQLDTFTIFPDGNADRDVTFYTGLLGSEPDLNGLTVADFSADTALGGLGLTQYNVNNTKSIDLATIDIATTLDINGGSGIVTGNVLLIGASITSGGDQIMLNGITTTVPLPASVWLFISAIGALVARRKLHA